MSNALSTLRRLIQPKTRQVGRVVSVSDNTLLVSLGATVVPVQRRAGDATTYTRGDRVAVEGGQVRGRRRTGTTYWL